MTPYYEDGGISIFHGDCRDMTGWLDADVLVTDPPYGRSWKQGDTGSAFGWRSNRHDGIIGDTDTAVRDEVLRLWGDRPAFVFGDLMLAPPCRTKLTLVYDKGEAAGFMGGIAGFRRNVEAVYALGPHRTGLGGRSAVLRSQTAHHPTVLTRPTGHPHTKPVDVLRTLIEASPSGLVADPFLGSGSTLVAAKDLGRKAIGVEVDERYCEIAARRLEQGVLDLGGVA